MKFASLKVLNITFVFNTSIWYNFSCRWHSNRWWISEAWVILIIPVLIDTIAVLEDIITANMEDTIMVHEGEIKYCFIIFFFFYYYYSFLLYTISQSKIRSNFCKLSEVTKIKMTKELHLAPWLYLLSCSY